MRRSFRHIAVMGILTLFSGAVYAQDGWRRDGDQDRDRDGDYRQGRQYAYQNDAAYRDGLAQGQYDRANNRRYNYQTNDWRRAGQTDRDAYRAGYEDGYNRNGTYRDRGAWGRNYPYGSTDPYGSTPNGNRGRHRGWEKRGGPYAGNDDYRNRGYGGGQYGNYGYGNSAYQQGLVDGRSDGMHDYSTGHSYRPTQDDNYKHADRGYNSSYGQKDSYKQSYRQGYLAGYEQGYRR